MIGIFISLWNRLFGGGISYVLDEYSGAAAAYSLRKLSSTYGGSAVRVRRASDNSEQDIGFVGQDLDETALMNFVGYQNLLQRSEEFGDAYWNKLGSSVSTNVTTDPFGTNNADSITETTANSAHEINTPNSFSFIVGQSYTFSVYAKQSVGTRNIILYLGTSVSFGSSRIAIFSLSTGQCVYNDAGVQFNSIPLANGWWRFSITSVAISSTATIGAFIAMANGSTFPANVIYNGDGVSTFFIYGAQLNVGTSAQPYQVTTSAARSGDGFVTKWYTQDSNGENLYLQSQTFTAVNWNKVQSAVAANAGTDPFGGNNATRWLSNVGANTHNLHQLNTLTVGQSYNVSFWVKSNTGSNQLFRLFGCDIVISSDLTATNDWQRFQFTFVATSNTAHGIARPSSNGAVDLLIYGAQLSQSTWLQPYQVTTTTAILRRDASQSTAASQPRIVGGGVIERENGKAGVRFLGTSGMELKTSYNTPVGAAAFFSAARLYAQTGGGTIGGVITADSGGGGIVYYSLSSPNGFVLDGAGVNLTNSASLAYNALSHMVLSGLYTSTTTSGTYLYSDGLLINNFTGTGVSRTSSLLSIGGRTGGSQPTRVFNGIIQEGLYYESNQLSNVLSIDRNLGGYYQTHWTGASSGLLDQFGGAAAAYSLRNLSSSYRGPLIRVRRSSDNAETDIGGTYNGDLDVASLVSFTGGQNLLLQSEDFSSGSWAKANTAITANATIAPDGTLTADKIAETAVNTEHAAYQSVSVSTSSVYTFSFYAKAAERSKFRLVFYLSSGTFDYYESYFDLSNGTVYRNGTAAAGLFISSSIQSVGNGWFRCSVTGNTNKTGTHAIRLSLLNDLFQVVYLGVAGSGVYIWGAQLNTGILQPYIPTTTAAVNGANAFVTKWYTQDNNYQNLLLQSQTFEAANWTKFASSISQDVISAPDGTLTADKLNETATTAQHGCVQVYTISTAQVHTLSFYAKAAERSNIAVVIYLNGGVGDNFIARYNLSTGIVQSTGTAGAAVLLSSSIQPVGDGWYRCSITGNTNVTGSHSCQISILDASFANSYVGVAGSGIYIWGAQLSEGTLVPYTATTTTVSQRRDAIQATAASQPRIVNAGGVESEGNRPAVFWTDGSGMRLTASFPAIPSPQTFFAVNRIGATSGISGAVLFDSYDSVQNIYYFKGTTETPNNLFNYSASGAGVPSIDGPVNSIPVQYLTNIVHDTTSSVYDNNLLTATGSAGTNTLSGLSIGNVRGNPTTVVAANIFDWFGDIQEFLVYPSNLATRLAVNSNINSYYRIYWQGNGTALLDSFSGASAAYSLRNLSSAYTGPLIRVRRSNDNVERDIYGTFGGDLDIASLVAFVGANSGFVTTWYDQSGSARHATQGTAANQPRIVNAGVVDTLNGKPSLVFDGTDDRLVSLVNIFLTDSKTLFGAFALRNTTNTFSCISDFFSVANTTSYGPLVYLGGVRFEINSLSNNGSAVVNTPYIITSDYTKPAGSAGTIRKNGVDSASGYRTNGLGGNNGISIGARGDGTWPADMTAFEFICYTTDVSTGISPIETNINNYYKIY